MRTFPLVIVTPDGEKFRGDAESLLVRTGSGDIEIMAGHTPCLCSIATGRARVRFADGEERLASASGGFMTVKSGAVELITTTFEWADEIDIARADASKTRAENVLSNKDASDTDIKLAQARLHRALVRKNVASYK